jgi:phage/plasmid-like protein (TIGR03299 family)
VTDAYEIFQNSEAFAFFDAIIGEGRAAYDSAGALFDGRYVWIMAKLNPEDFKKRKSDKIDHYVLLTNNFGQRKVITMRGCGTRVVCYNTMSVAMSERESVFRIPHRGDLQGQVAVARDSLGIMTKAMRDLEMVLDEIRGIKMPERELATFAHRMSPEREAEQYAIRYLFKHGIGCEGKTRYDAWNAVTQFTTHHLTARGDATRRAERRLNSVMTGRGHLMQKRALALLMP